MKSEYEKLQYKEIETALLNVAKGSYKEGRDNVYYEAYVRGYGAYGLSNGNPPQLVFKWREIVKEEQKQDKST